MPAFTSGAIVTHLRYGTGRIEAITASGRLARVFFKSIDFAKDVSLDELTLPRTEGLALGTPDAVHRPQVPQQRARRRDEVRLSLECLRQGLPPAGDLRRWTVGFEAPLGRFTDALEASGKAQGVVLEVRGAYGKGKSHLGRLARELALERRWVVLNLELDGTALSLTQSARLFSRLLGSLQLPADGQGVLPPPGLGTLLQLVGERLRGRAPKGCEALAPVLAAWDTWRGDEAAVELLEGYLTGDVSKASAEYRLRQLHGLTGIALPTLGMASGKTNDRVQAQVDQLVRVVRLARECGAAGAVLLLDELDHDLGSKGFKLTRAQETLKALVRGVRGEPIVAVLLSTPGYDLGVEGLELIELPELREAHLLHITRQAVDAFAATQLEWRAETGSADQLFESLLRRFKKDFQRLGWGPRFFVRAAIEACEVSAREGKPLGEVEV